MNYNKERVEQLKSAMDSLQISFLRFGVYEWKDEFYLEDSYFTIEYQVDSTMETAYSNLNADEQQLLRDAVVDQLQDAFYDLAVEFPINGGSGLYEFSTSPLQIVKVGELFLTPKFEAIEPTTISLRDIG